MTMMRLLWAVESLVMAAGCAGRLHAGSGDALAVEAIQAAAGFSARNRGRVLVIIERGRVRYEKRPLDAGPTTGWRIYSGTKAFWGIAALGAVEDGLLRLDEKAAATLPEWQEDPVKSRITIRQLLDFTSGLDPVFAIHEDGLRDRNAMALRSPVVAEPGTRFIYGPCSIQVLHEVLKRKLAARSATPTNYLEHRVLAPLGLGPQRYLADRSGNPLLASGFILSTSMWERMGHAMLNHGRPLISRRSFRACCEGTPVNPCFAFGFWNNAFARHAEAKEVDVEKMLHEKWFNQDWSNACLCRDAPDDLLACVGSGGQRLYVVPSRELVVIRHGHASDLDDAAFLRLLFQKPIPR